ncbi:hypothetical protein CCHR01_10828 [Colletotrichum chrysophilum]|uniref:Uncharacterized protein n=1 Tax=Colletotrichum chrysophilum TaxID=1836956 RepID=A0AAD9AFV2_9PEZI|nr:hypothetical protein CCHR01_10828 [Colletotrichum chrysophilum]
MHDARMEKAKEQRQGPVETTQQSTPPVPCFLHCSSVPGAWPGIRRYFTLFQGGQQGGAPWGSLHGPDTLPESPRRQSEAQSGREVGKVSVSVTLDLDLKRGTFDKVWSWRRRRATTTGTRHQSALTLSPARYSHHRTAQVRSADAAAAATTADKEMTEPEEKRKMHTPSDSRYTYTSCIRSAVVVIHGIRMGSHHPWVCHQSKCEPTTGSLPLGTRTRTHDSD